jgi:ketosteroid isomerase-like protein
MSSADTERAVREFYRAYAEQDGEASMQLMAPDQLLHVSGRNALSGDYRGTEEIFGYIGKVGAWTGGQGGFEIDGS